MPQSYCFGGPARPTATATRRTLPSARASACTAGGGALGVSTALAVTEAQFLRQVLDLARIYRWMAYHPALSKWSERGWPDLALVRPPHLVLAELKTDRGRTTEHQDRWLAALRACPGVETYLWRPADFDAIAAGLGISEWTVRTYRDEGRRAWAPARPRRPPSWCAGCGRPGPVRAWRWSPPHPAPAAPRPVTSGGESRTAPRRRRTGPRTPRPARQPAWARPTPASVPALTPSASAGPTAVSCAAARRSTRSDRPARARALGPSPPRTADGSQAVTDARPPAPPRTDPLAAALAFAIREAVRLEAERTTLNVSPDRANVVTMKPSPRRTLHDRPRPAPLARGPPRPQGRALGAREHGRAGGQLRTDAQPEQQARAIERWGLVDTGAAWQVAHSGRTIAATGQWAEMLDGAGQDWDLRGVGADVGRPERLHPV